MSKKIRLSHSSLESFNRCPYLYYLKHLQHVKPFAPIRYPLVTGVAFHTLVNQMYATCSFSREFLVRNWKRVFQDALETEASSFSNTVGYEKYLNYGYGLVSRFFEFARLNGYLVEPIQTEWSFTVELDAVSITGIVDLIIQRNKSSVIEVVDFKTGWKVPSVEEVRFNKQLTIYDWAVANELSYERRSVSLFFPRRSVILSTSRNTEDHAGILAELKDVSCKITNRAFEPNFDSCKKCEFTAHCDHYIKNSGSL